MYFQESHNSYNTHAKSKLIPGKDVKQEGYLYNKHKMTQVVHEQNCELRMHENTPTDQALFDL